MRLVVATGPSCTLRLHDATNRYNLLIFGSYNLGLLPLRVKFGQHSIYLGLYPQFNSNGSKSRSEFVYLFLNGVSLYVTYRP